MTRKYRKLTICLFLIFSMLFNAACSRGAASAENSTGNGASQNSDIRSPEGQTVSDGKLQTEQTITAEQPAQEGREVLADNDLPDTYPRYILNDKAVKLLGRTCLIDENLWCAMSGTGVEFIYKGGSLELSFLSNITNTNADNQARVAIYVDGERVCDEILRKKLQTISVYKGEVREITVKVIKLSESAGSVIGIKPVTVAEGERITPIDEKPYKIEFIGDSITCGYGVDDENKDHHFSTSTEDVTKAYAYKTAELLDADYSMFSVSGYGIVSGYTDDPGERKADQTIPPIYEKLGVSYQLLLNKLHPEEMDWNFDAFQPEVVVINLGTNDSSYCNTDDRRQEFIDAYYDFLKLVREKNPNAQIICTLGLMGNDLLASISSAVLKYTNDTGDSRVSVIELPAPESADGYAADYHPTESAHKRAAEVLAAEIKKLMKL